MSKVISVLKNLPGWISRAGMMGLLALLLFPYSRLTQTVILVTAVAFPLDWILNRSWENWHWNHLRGAFLLVMLVGFLAPIWRLLGIDGSPDWIHAWETMLPFAVFGLFGVINVRPFRTEYYAATALTTFCALTVWILAHVGWVQLPYNLNSVWNVFNYFRAEAHFTHMAFNLYGNAALVLGYVVLRRENCAKWQKLCLGAEMLLTMLAVGISEGRTGLFTLCLLVLGGTFAWLWQRNRALALVAAILLAGAGAGLMAWQNTAREDTREHDPRYYHTRLSLRLISERPVLGRGAAEGHEVYVERALADPDEMKYYIEPDIYNNPQLGPEYAYMAHPHNTFSEITIAFGLVGLALFLCMIGCLVFAAPPTARLGVVMLMMVFVFQALFEKMGSNFSPFLWMLTIFLMLYSPEEQDA